MGSTYFAFLAGMAAGFITGILHTALGIPGILASILTQISFYSINLNIMGSSNQAVSVDKYPLVVSLRYISDSSATKVRLFVTCVLFLRGGRCPFILVFRNRAGTCHPRNRM